MKIFFSARPQINTQVHFFVFLKKTLIYFAVINICVYLQYYKPKNLKRYEKITKLFRC